MSIANGMSFYLKDFLEGLGFKVHKVNQGALMNVCGLEWYPDDKTQHPYYSVVINGTNDLEYMNCLSLALATYPYTVDLAVQLGKLYRERIATHKPIYDKNTQNMSEMELMELGSQLEEIYRNAQKLLEIKRILNEEIERNVAENI